MHRTRVPQVRVVQTPGANVEIACGRRQLRQVSRLPASPISARSSKQCLCAPDAERAIRAGLGSIEAVARLDVGSAKLQARVRIATGLAVVGDFIAEGSGVSRPRTLSLARNSALSGRLTHAGISTARTITATRPPRSVSRFISASMRSTSPSSSTVQARATSTLSSGRGSASARPSRNSTV